MTIAVSDRLILRPASTDPKVVMAVVAFLNDPETVQFSEQRHVTHTLHSQLDYLELMTYPNLYMEIHTPDGLVGTISAHVDVYNNNANVGILIGRKFWGQGFGTKAWETFSNHLFANGIRKIEAGCMSSNKGMLRVFQKTRMAFEGMRHEHFINGDHLIQYGRFA